jgi:hypothetical protein
MIATAGRWDPSEKNVYFIASGIDTLLQGAKCHSHLLCAVNEIRNDEHVLQLAKWVEDGKRLFIDSGVFWLTNEHATRSWHTTRVAFAPLATGMTWSSQ